MEGEIVTDGAAVGVPVGLYSLVGKFDGVRVGVIVGVVVGG